MANNRMWLLHKPTMLAVLLGKRMAVGWYQAPDKDELERFYRYLEHHPMGSQDDFVIAMEDCSGSSVFEGWDYTREEIDGFALLKNVDPKS